MDVAATTGWVRVARGPHARLKAFDARAMNKERPWRRNDVLRERRMSCSEGAEDAVHPWKFETVREEWRAQAARATAVGSNHQPGRARYSVQHVSQNKICFSAPAGDEAATGDAAAGLTSRFESRAVSRGALSARRMTWLRRTWISMAVWRLRTKAKRKGTRAAGQA
ncbi:unnamed protein product, partial [Ectocarpus sp. 4 AP-2014]